MPISKWVLIALGVAFNAGVVYATGMIIAKQFRKDLNGIGKKTRELEAAASEDRVTNALTVMLHAQDDETRWKFANLMMHRKR